MLGRDHARLAALAALAVGAGAGWRPELDLAAAAAVAGAALLPDLDEPGSSVARLVGPVSEVVAWTTKRVCGGHRMASHSLLAVAVAGLGTWALGRVELAPGVPASVVVLGACLALAARTLLPARLRLGHLTALVVAAVASWWLATHTSLAWLPLAAAAGVALHLVADGLTAGGVPALWPWRRHFALPLLAHTGSTREKVAGVVMLLLVVLLVVRAVVPLVHPAVAS